MAPYNFILGKISDFCGWVSFYYFNGNVNDFMI
nr:MAG TPA: hypothetical protein [Caudoviricetes sp.]